MVFSACSAQPTPAVGTELCHSGGQSLADRPLKEKIGLECLTSAPARVTVTTASAGPLGLTRLSAPPGAVWFTLTPSSLRALSSPLSDPDPAPFPCSPELQSQRQHLFNRTLLGLSSTFSLKPRYLRRHCFPSIRLTMGPTPH